MSPGIQIPVLTRLLFFYRTFPPLVFLSEIHDYLCSLTVMEVQEGGKYMPLIGVLAS